MAKPAEAIGFAGPLLAALAGVVFCLRSAWIGYLMYWQQPGINTDTLATAFLALPWAIAGLLLAALVGGLIAVPFFLFKISGKSYPLPAGLITCLLLVFATAKLPEIAFRLFPIQSQASQPITAKHVPNRMRPEDTCQGPIPPDSQKRKIWESECR